MQNEWARTLEAHEEALGIFLNEPDLFRESLPLLKPDLFLDYEWLYWVMRNVEDREGLTYQGVVRSPECPAERLDLVRMLKETFFNENRSAVTDSGNEAGTEQAGFAPDRHGIDFPAGCNGFGRYAADGSAEG